MANMLEAISLFSSSAALDFVILDVRSPGEFAKGHIPGAVNFPLLDDEQRKEVGTCYKQNGHHEAVLLGFKLAGPLFYEKLKWADEFFAGKKLLVHCWRGGLRSRIMAWLLELSGFSVSILKGGYKSYRRLIRQHLDEKSYHFMVLGGKTGTGKTHILQNFSSKAQVIDLESLANHKGSVFGGLGKSAQPTQEMFENMLGNALMQFNRSIPIWVENESRMIGKIHIPNALYFQILDSPIFQIELPLHERVQNIIHEYGGFEPEVLEEKTRQLEKRLGNQRMNQAINFLREKDLRNWTGLLLEYYDKTYEHGYLKRKPDKRFTIKSKNIDEILEELEAINLKFTHQKME